MRQLLACFFVLVVSGCLADSPSESQHENPPAENQVEPIDATSIAKGATSLGAKSLPLTMNWSNCRGAAGLSDTNPEAANDPEVPDGVEHDWPINEFYFEAYECERISIGPFERGPIRIVFEAHSNWEPPAKCQDGDYHRSVGLSNVFVNDLELATYLREVLFMPAHLASIDLETLGLDAPQTVKWSWSVNGSESWIQLIHHGGLEASADFTQRYFWFSQHRLGVMQNTYHESYDAPTIIEGIFSSPSVYALNGPTPYYGTGGTMESVKVTNWFAWYEDIACERPLY